MLDKFVKGESQFVKELRHLPIPPEYRHEFGSHFAAVDMIRKYYTSEAEVLYWLAYEYQNQKRSKVLLRLHMRYNKLRLERERRELQCQDTRY